MGQGSDLASRTALPVAPGERLLALDVLRGFALFGVFAVNASVSARPFAEAVAPPGEAWSSEWFAWAFLNGAFVTKFVALFSFLFGMGLVLHCRRLEERGDSPFVYLRRLAWLAAFGLVHGFLLFEGDILFPYALAGGLLFALRERPAASLVRIALAVYLVGLALDALWALRPPSEDPEFDALVARAHEEGPLALVLAVRAQEYVGWLLASSVTHFNWQVVALFLPRARARGAVSALFALQVFASTLWLARFEMGPLEWLWRRLTYGPSVVLRPSS